MEQRRFTGKVRLTSQVTPDQLTQALADHQNQTVAVHREGAIVRGYKGRLYRCNALGQWVRLRDKEVPRDA